MASSRSNAAALGAHSGQKIRRDGHVPGRGKVVGEATDPIRQAAVLMDHDHRQRLFGDFRKGDESVDGDVKKSRARMYFIVEDMAIMQPAAIHL